MSKTGLIMGSPVAGRRASGWRPVLCPEHISKSILAMFMKFCGWTNLIKVPIAPNYKGVCLQNTSKPHSYNLKIW